MNSNCKKVFFFIFTLVFIMMRPMFIAYGQNNAKTVNATVKLSICGDEIVEGPEDCEGNNLNGTSCTALGYGGGDLTCDIACTFDTSACTAPTPTPTPSPTPIPSDTPTPIASPFDESLLPATPEPTIFLSTTNTPTSSPTPTLPLALQVFDINGLGKISISDVPVVVKLWVEEWKRVLSDEENGVSESTQHKKCDVNEDGKCDIQDFSVLMFYVER